MVSTDAVTEESKQLHEYEMVLIINPELSDEDIEATLDKTSRFITERGGVVSDIERWGRRRLAYPIRHFGNGSYFLARFTMDPALGRELEASLKISEDVLRHLLIRLDT